MGHLANWAARLFRRLADRRLEPLGLSSGHLPVLTALMRNEAMSQKALTEHAALEQPTMAATLARMERDGLVERRPDPKDGRSSFFSLTPTTRSKLPAVQAAVESINADVFAGLGEDERRRSRQLLEGMIASLGKALGE